MYFFKLVRWPNLLIVLLTQYLIFFRLLNPVFQLNKIQPQLNTDQFLFFILTTLCVTACGYIINDLIDQKTDAINKPQKRIVGVHISTQVSNWLYITLAVIGFFLALYLAFATDNLEWLFLYPVISLFLIVYSSHLKQKPLVGNLIVALLCSGVTGIVWIAEMKSIQLLSMKAPLVSHKLTVILIWYMVFAFLATLFREIIKDLQDVEGDQLTNCRTVPIAWGVPKAKLLALCIGGLLVVLLFVQFFVLQNIFQRSILLYSLLALFIPLAVSFQRIVVASTTKDYWWISQLIKLILINGVLLLFFIRL